MSDHKVNPVVTGFLAHGFTLHCLFGALSQTYYVDRTTTGSPGYLICSSRMDSGNDPRLASHGERYWQYSVHAALIDFRVELLTLCTGSLWSYLVLLTRRFHLS